ncbi:hypothetical protein L202_08090 [Cryptococcus amylolentus CBS 6039]|uniref:Yeast cell wall synthesis Kre9/Knh1-like N-terminal domain-containing protein n=2 Tax=Cryptococcus amylolentus TaxID=104669 RepID=A0A1E3HB73_9TREE|nr:hypothetical protein L202_08090 [Cryptococcus amylolentus CBS 6039]ODN73589.1 hypothetical protein L202_08090 [Cryptococcus amylolentus CBS 6039]ODN99323.1 hypothetical protein I350_07491 [Cryptococcus amylolentus CBS 6273]
MFTKTFTALSLAALAANAIIAPTSPDSSTSVKVGEDIEALWTVDSVDDWSNVEIQLMTGSNLAMVALATVATGIDGTSASSYTFTAPDVSPYSKIYFLQFTNGGDMSNVTWTTRFTIAGSDGSTTDPTNTTDSVEWGTGTLLTTISNSTSSSTDSSSASSSASASASTSSVASAAADVASTSSEAASSSAASSGSSSSSTASASSANASSSSSTSAAGKLEVGVVAALLGGVAALASLF